MGVLFDDWQDGAGRLILAKRSDGKLAAMVGGVGMSMPRQVGKTYLFAAMLFALAILRPGLLAIWTAHHSRTSSETFLAMQGFARRRRIAPYVENVYKGSGDEAIVFRNGSRILFGARERGFGRGIPGVDVLMCDEAGILTDRALDNMLATLNTSDFGLAVFVGTPPRPEDPSEAFTRMRTDALSGEATDTVWIEFGADPQASPDDRKEWAKGNPSYPHRTPAESIQRLRKKLTHESFMREGMGIWDDMDGGVFGASWGECADKALEPPADLVIGVAVSVDQKWASVGAAGLIDGKVVLAANRREAGTDWLVDHVVDVAKRRRCKVVVDENGPAGHLLPALRKKGLRLEETKTADFLEACAGLHKRVTEGLVVHPSHPELDAAVRAAVRRDVGDRWAWGRRKSTADISMLEAVTLAAWEVWRHEKYNLLDSVR